MREKCFTHYRHYYDIYSELLQAMPVYMAEAGSCSTYRKLVVAHYKREREEEMARVQCKR